MKRIFLPDKEGKPVIVHRALVALRLRQLQKDARERDQKFEKFCRDILEVKQ